MSSPVSASRETRADVIGAARGAFETGGLWELHARGPAGWDEAARRSKRLVDELVGVAERALSAAGVPGVTAMGCTVGTITGLGHVAEWIHQRLSAKGPSWLDPEAFVHYPAHAIAGLACQQLGLKGAATTLLGATAGEQAFDQGLRSIRLGRDALHLVGAYELLTPAASERLEKLGVKADSSMARAAFVVLAAPADRGAARGSNSIARSQATTYESVATDWPATLARLVIAGQAWERLVRGGAR